MKVNTYHHVFTSLGGYKTVKVSDGVPQSTVDALEEYSRQSHKLARRYVRFSILSFDEIFVGVSRLSLAGSDHVGRTRALVQNILFRRDEVERIAFFDPFALPKDLFLTAKGDIPLEAAQLPTNFEFAARNPVAHYPHDRIPQRMARNLLRALLHEGTTIVRSVEGEAYKLIRFLLPFLPPIAREHTSILTGDYLPTFDGKGKPTIFLVPPEFDLTPLAEAGYPTLDEGGQSGTNLPKAHPYARMVLGLLYGSQADRVKLVTLLRAINTYRPIVRYTPESYKNLVQGFGTAKGFFSRDGHLHVEGAPEKGLEGALHFFRAGHPDIVFDIFNSCLHVLGKRNLMSGLVNFENVVVSGIDTLTSFFSEVPADVQMLDDIGDFDE